MAAWRASVDLWRRKPRFASKFRQVESAVQEYTSPGLAAQDLDATANVEGTPCISGRVALPTGRCAKQNNQIKPSQLRPPEKPQE